MGPQVALSTHPVCLYIPVSKTIILVALDKPKTGRDREMPQGPRSALPVVGEVGRGS